MVYDTVWEEIFRDHSWGKYPPEDIVRYIARNFYSAPDRASVKILEVGCGPGANLFYLAREGFAAYGVDGSPTAIKHALERLDAECPAWHGDLKNGDMISLPWPDNFFDAVLDNEAIYSNPWHDARQIYKEMCRVTKPHGKMLSITFANGCIGDETGEKVGRNAWIVADGPLAGNGLARFTTLDEIPDLVSPWEIEEINLKTHTIDGVKAGKVVKQWIISAQKKN